MSKISGQDFNKKYQEILVLIKPDVNLQVDVETQFTIQDFDSFISKVKNIDKIMKEYNDLYHEHQFMLMSI